MPYDFESSDETGPLEGEGAAIDRFIIEVDVVNL